MSSRKEYIQQAIDLFGSQAALGAKIGFSQNAVFKALSLGRVSPVMAARIEAVTAKRKRKIPRELLCPVFKKLKVPSDGKFPPHDDVED